MRKRLITAPTLLPISVVEVKTHLRVDFADDDALIGQLLDSAIKHCESYMGKPIMSQRWRFSWDVVTGSELILPAYYVTDLQNLFRRDPETGLGSTLSDLISIAGVYEYNPLNDWDGEFRLRPLGGGAWPAIESDGYENFFVEVIHGFNSPDLVPNDVIAAVQMLTAFWYKQAEAGAPVNFQQIPFGVEEILNNHRAWSLF